MKEAGYHCRYHEYEKNYKKEYYEQLCAYKFDNLDEMGPSEGHDLPKLTQKEIDN